MATLWKIGDKAKGVLILAAWIVGHIHRVLQALVKIFDDSEVTTVEALSFVTSETPVWVGEWKGRGKEQAAEPQPQESTPAPDTGFDPSEYARAVAEDAIEDATQAIFKRRKG